MVCLYKLRGEDAEKMLAVGIGSERMQLVGEDKNRLMGLQKILNLIDCYHHLSTAYRDQLKARVQMHRKTEIMSAFDFEKVAVKRIF